MICMCVNGVIFYCFIYQHISTFFCETAAVPVHVDMDPEMGQAAEQNFMSELTRANAIVDRLIQTSPNVVRLRRRLRHNPSDRERDGIEDQLMNEYEAALYQGGVPPGMVPSLAHMLAHNTVRDIYMEGTRHGDSIVVYFICKTVQSLYSLGQMIVSGFMHAVFAVAVESFARTSVDVYVKGDEFNVRLLCLMSPQDKGSFVHRPIVVIGLNKLLRQSIN